MSLNIVYRSTESYEREQTYKFSSKANTRYKK